MSQVLVTESHLEDIADAIRDKLGVSTTYRPGDMAAAIESIDTAGEMEPLTARANGEYAPTAPVEGFDSVSVEVPTFIASIVQDAVLLSGEQVSVVSDAVDINTANKFIHKRITANGTYDPGDDNAQAYSSVTVDVEGGGISGVYKSSGAPASSLGNDGDIYIRTYDLPSNVNFVEYLQGDGNAYIDTGIIADENTGAYAKFEVTGGYPVFSARYSASSRAYGIICVDDGATLSLDMDTVRTQSPTSIGNVVEAKMNRFIKEKDGATIGTTNPNSFTTPANVTLFAINATNSYGLVVSPSKLHRVVFTQSGIVTHDFLPALDGNGVACMYESISGTYFYNAAASGSFSYGNTITPDEAEPTIYTKVNGVWKVITQIGAV